MSAPTPAQLQEVAALVDPLAKYAKSCHAASKLIVEQAPWQCRVARGACIGVPGQHSWVVLGDDCYDPRAGIIDPTLWSYAEAVDGIWGGTALDGRHTPFGRGSIWEWGRPQRGYGGEILRLTPPEGESFSPRAENFMRALGPMDRDAWMALASHAPVEGWPAGEILAAIERALPAFVPVDRLGMLTNLNPDGLYLPKGREHEFPTYRED